LTTIGSGQIEPQPFEVAPGERVVDDGVQRLMEVFALQRLRDVRERQVVREREGRPNVTLATAGDGQVDRQHQRREPGLDRRLDKPLRERAVARPVELEPLRRAGSKPRPARPG